MEKIIQNLKSKNEFKIFEAKTSFNYWQLLGSYKGQITKTDFKKIISIIDNSDDVVKMGYSYPYIEWADEGDNFASNDYFFNDTSYFFALLDQDFNLFWCAEGREKELEELIKIERSKNPEK